MDRNQNGESDIEQAARAELAAGAPTYSPATAYVVDAVGLARAQGKFIKAQTRFLLQTNSYGSQGFTDELGAYSRAQTDFIDSLQLALHQANVI